MAVLASEYDISAKQDKPSSPFIAGQPSKKFKAPSATSEETNHADDIGWK